MLNDHSIGHSTQFLVELITLRLEAVIVELVNSKCLSTLLYGLEACPLKSADLKSFDYTFVRAFMKIFKTKSKEVTSCSPCMEMFNCSLPSVSVNNRKCL